MYLYSCGVAHSKKHQANSSRLCFAPPLAAREEQLNRGTQFVELVKEKHAKEGSNV